eukprot:scaffold260790_cov14-Tisochrysis_lutea.AAC.1
MSWHKGWGGVGAAATNTHTPAAQQTHTSMTADTHQQHIRQTLAAHHTPAAKQTHTSSTACSQACNEGMGMRAHKVQHSTQLQNLWPCLNTKMHRNKCVVRMG